MKAYSATYKFELTHEELSVLYDVFSFVEDVKAIDKTVYESNMPKESRDKADDLAKMIDTLFWGEAKLFKDVNKVWRGAEK